MKNIVCILPNFMTADCTLRALKNFRLYYPDIPVYIIDDETVDEDKAEYFHLHNTPAHRTDLTFDQDSDKLVGLPNTAYIRVPLHKRELFQGHGYAITYAMKFIHAKWVFHLSSDVRLIKPGVIEYMLEKADDKTCIIGHGNTLVEKYPNIHKMIFMMRGDLFNQYDCEFLPHLELGQVDTGAFYIRKLLDEGYKILDIPVTDFYFHLRYDPGYEEIWNKWY
jgi:hypothetical protein